jgi:hypothetical protein
VLPYSENDVAGTAQRLSMPSHCRQWGELTLRMFVTPLSVFPLTNFGGVGITRRSIASSRSPSGAYAAYRGGSVRMDLQ